MCLQKVTLPRLFIRLRLDRTGGFEEERRPVRLSRRFEGHFILPQVSVSVTNSSVSGELTSQKLACRRQRIDVAAGGVWGEGGVMSLQQQMCSANVHVSFSFPFPSFILSNCNSWLVLSNGCAR